MSTILTVAYARQLARRKGHRVAAEFLKARNVPLSTALYWLTGSIRP